MKLASAVDSLWGNKAKLRYLLIVSALLLFTMLGAREIWTQEHRWADVVAGMFYRHDFLHPYIGETRYYDKPLLSYWLIAAFAYLRGELTTQVLRLPSALAGMLAIWSIYRLGRRIKDQQLGLLSGWLLLSSFFFIFWARISSADMLNMAGSLFAVAWYFDKKDHASLHDYTVFFLILALTSLCKGLGGVVIPLIAVFVDVCQQHTWKKHLRLPLFASLIPALIVYLAPFWASSHFGGEAYGQNGLYMVFRENILRYFEPFDHRGPIYTYFIYLPLYLFPWSLFFIVALFTCKSRWKHMSMHAKWVVWTSLLLFLFFTLSGSRRSYYVLPLVPFALLFTADWILSVGVNTARRCLWTAGIIMTVCPLIFISQDLLPAWYYSHYGIHHFANKVKDEAEKSLPWAAWKVVMLDADYKLFFYLHLPPETKGYDFNGKQDQHTAVALARDWQHLMKDQQNTIFITRRFYAPLLRAYFAGYREIEMPIHIKLPFFPKQDELMPVAFIPPE